MKTAKWHVAVTLFFLSFCAGAQQAGSLYGIILRGADGNPVCCTVKSNTSSVFIFLSPECPISQQYTATLNRLCEISSADHIAFYGIVPGAYYDTAAIMAFRKQYGIQFPILADPAYRLTRALNASITPEVFLVNDQEVVQYSGAIDNAYVALGRKRPVVTAHYLQDALNSVRNKKTVTIKKTKATGCLIEFEHAGN